MRTREVNGKVYEILFTGRRGSHTLALQTSASDEDFLHVLATHENFAQDNVDDMVLSEAAFMKLVLSCELEAIEALFSRVYITNDFQETYALLLASVLEKKKVSDAKLKFKLFRAVRNQYKLYLKYGKEGDFSRSCKHLSKVYLYLELVESDDALSCFIDHKLDSAVRERYFTIREGLSEEEAALLGESYRAIGTNKSVRDEKKALLENKINELVELD